jgi:hypothetical protein
VLLTWCTLLISAIVFRIEQHPSVDRSNIKLQTGRELQTDPLLVTTQSRLSLRNSKLRFKKIVFLSILSSHCRSHLAGSSVDFTNSGGTLAGTNSGLTLTRSTLIAGNGLGGGPITGNDLAAISFCTGVLSSGSLQMGGTFARGGLFSITGNGTSGVPTGVIFNGSFTDR